MENINIPNKSMAYEWIGAAIAGAGTAAASFAGQHPVKNFRHAKELAAYNTALSEEMYNKYQSPAAQMRQYKEAGLNPYLMYNQQLQGTPQATPVEYDQEAFEPHADRAIQGLANGIAQYQQLVGQQQQLENAKKQADYMAAQTALTEGKIAMQNFKIEKQQERYDMEKAFNSVKLQKDSLDLMLNQKYKEQEIVNKLDNQIQDLVNKKTKNRVDEANIELLKEKKNEVMKNVEWLDTRIGYTRFSMDLQNKKYDLDLRKFAETQYQNRMANKWKQKKYGLDLWDRGMKLYQQVVSEDQFDRKLQTAKDAAAGALLFNIGKYLDKTAPKGGWKFDGNLSVPQQKQAWKALNPVQKPILL